MVGKKSLMNNNNNIWLCGKKAQPPQCRFNTQQIDVSKIV